MAPARSEAQTGYQYQAGMILTVSIPHLGKKTSCVTCLRRRKLGKRLSRKGTNPKIWLCAQLFFDEQARSQILSISELLEERCAIRAQRLAIGRRIAGRRCPSINDRPREDGGGEKLQSREMCPRDAHGVEPWLSGQRAVEWNCFSGPVTCFTGLFS